MLKDVLPRDSTERKTWNEKPVSPASAWGGRQTVKPLWIWGAVFFLFFFLLLMNGTTPSSGGEVQIRGEQMTAADKMLALKRRRGKKDGGRSKATGTLTKTWKKKKNQAGRGRQQ